MDLDHVIKIEIETLITIAMIPTIGRGVVNIIVIMWIIKKMIILIRIRIIMVNGNGDWATWTRGSAVETENQRDRKTEIERERDNR